MVFRTLSRLIPFRFHPPVRDRDPFGLSLPVAGQARPGLFHGRPSVRESQRTRHCDNLLSYYYYYYPLPLQYLPYSRHFHTDLYQLCPARAMFQTVCLSAPIPRSPPPPAKKCATVPLAVLGAARCIAILNLVQEEV
jgi:hypothetical protein